MRTIVLMAFAMLANLVVAQINKNIADTNKIWHNTSNCAWGESFPSIIKLGNDTNINSNVYKRVICMGNPAVCYSGIVGLVREYGNRVYFLNKSNLKEGIIYDFGLVDNDTIFVENYFSNSIHSLIVKQVDTVLINNQPIKKISFGNIDEYWLEGIGSSLGLLYSGSLLDTTSCSHELICFKENGFEYLNPKYPDCGIVDDAQNGNKSNNRKKSSVEPNPFNGFATIEFDGQANAIHQITIYSHSGQKVQTEIFYGNEYQIKATDLTKGFYLYIIFGDNNTRFNGKFIKQ